MPYDAKYYQKRICKEAQLSRSTFYFQFTDKYDLLDFLCSALDIGCVKRIDGKVIQKNIVSVDLYVVSCGFCGKYREHTTR